MGIISFKLNGKTVQGEEGQYLIEVAENYGVSIPTLCYHKVLEPAGMCRLCTVELFDGRRTKFVTACNYPIWEGMEVTTNSKAVINGRKLIIEMLLARCPDVPILQKLAKEYNIEKVRFKKENETCILCGLCTRICTKIGNSAISLTSRGLSMSVDSPFHVKTDFCIACGACVNICPTGHITYEKLIDEVTKLDPTIIPSEYEEGLAGRKPIYVPYAQAIPNTPAIDRSVCAHFKTDGCQVCSEICPVNAIDHNTKDETIEINVGSIIIATGFEPYKPKKDDIYGYNKYPNVMTSLEFERMLSASGPFGGHVIRPSDHKEPKKIAWIQCVGSRDKHDDSVGYCSSVCCTYAIKEAVMAKDHVDNLDTAIFYIDIRTHGKDFEVYYNNAKEKSGVRFIKSRISDVKQIDNNGLLQLSYIDENSGRIEEEFDIVVLSIGLCASKENALLFNKADISIDNDGYPINSSFNPVATTKNGIFVSGAAHSPNDIPTSVINASAAAGSVGSILSDVRWSATKTKSLPKQIDLKGTPPRIGIFVCHCGSNIAGVVSISEVVEFAKKLPFVVFVTDSLFTCSQDSQVQIKQVIKDHNLNRIIVAACTPRTHEPIFQETLVEAGLNKYLFEMVNIRNHCSWVHNSQPKLATQKSKDLIEMSASKTAKLDPLQEYELTVNQQALVVGGGLAGMTAAKNLADQGYVTHLVEKNESLGGVANDLYTTWKEENIKDAVNNLVDEVNKHDKIKLYLDSEIKNVDGSVGNFTSKILCKQAEDKEVEINHGVAVIATGAKEFKPNEYLYGKNQKVITSMELDKKLKAKEASLSNIKTAVFVQCVGSRIPQRPYCSKVCCTHSINSAIELIKKNPKMQIYIIYRDLRPYGLRENLYRQARDMGVHFIKYKSEEKLDVTEDKQKLAISFTDYVLKRKIQIKSDLLVLASAMVTENTSELSQMFKVPVNEDGYYIEAHVKLRPVDFATDGVFVCGLAHSPKPIDESIAQAQAAAARAVNILSNPIMKLKGTVATIDTIKCTSCGVCVQVCPFKAISFNDKQQPEVNNALCKGCGTCAASCRSGAASLMGFSNEAIFAQIGIN